MGEIALWTDFDTTLTLLDVYPWLYHPSFWKRKMALQQPHKSYFDFWTGKENYLNTTKFIVLTHYRFDYYPFIYAYDPFTFHVCSKINPYSEDAFEPIRISTTHRYIRLYQLELKTSNDIDDVKTPPNKNDRCYVIDLKNYIPHFKVYGAFREPADHHGSVLHLHD